MQSRWCEKSAMQGSRCREPGAWGHGDRGTSSACRRSDFFYACLWLLESVVSILSFSLLSSLEHLTLGIVDTRTPGIAETELSNQYSLVQVWGLWAPIQHSEDLTQRMEGCSIVITELAEHAYVWRFIHTAGNMPRSRGLPPSCSCRPPTLLICRIVQR